MLIPKRIIPTKEHSHGSDELEAELVLGHFGTPCAMESTGREGDHVLTIKGKLSCCYAIRLRNMGLWPLLRTSIPVINFSGKLAAKIERAGYYPQLF